VVNNSGFTLQESGARQRGIHAIVGPEHSAFRAGFRVASASLTPSLMGFYRGWRARARRASPVRQGLERRLDGLHDVARRGGPSSRGGPSVLPVTCSHAPDGARHRATRAANRALLVSDRWSGPLPSEASQIVAPGLTASRDGRTVSFTRADTSVDELMLVDDFK